MKIVKSIAEWREIFDDLQEMSVGFVPTMGFLHQGHMSLVRRSVAENKITAVSIFVNPTQFNNQSDLDCYPIDLHRDRQMLSDAGVDYVLEPTYDELYNDGFRYRVSEHRDSLDLCGATREGHFVGVLTVVMKLLNITKATKAYFGEKDWQQLQLIRGMAEAFFMDTVIEGCPIVREDSGLALSSRNKLIAEENKAIAPFLHETISSGLSVDEMKNALESKGFKVDYLKEKDGRIFVAAFLGDVRLIDNVKR